MNIVHEETPSAGTRFAKAAQGGSVTLVTDSFQLE
jgi:hypothetical protein